MTLGFCWQHCVRLGLSSCLVAPSFTSRGLHRPSVSLLTLCWGDSFAQTPTRRSIAKACYLRSIMSDSSNQQHQSAPSTTVVEQKKALRKDIRAKLRVLSRPELLAQSDQVWQRLFALPAYQQASAVGLFLSMPAGEICTQAALQRCVRDGKRIYVPQVGRNFESADMELLQVYAPPRDDDESGGGAGTADANDGKMFYDDWPRNKWGIPEPPGGAVFPAAQPGDIDLLVVPGLAFDRQGNRLGQGKGYYDRFIARVTTTMPTDNSNNARTERPRLVAVSLECQLVSSSIPVQAYDRTMHTLLLPSETIHLDQP